MCGLHGILATASKLIENSSVLYPILAVAKAASHPACPVSYTHLCFLLNFYIYIHPFTILLIKNLLRFLSGCSHLNHSLYT